MRMNEQGANRILRNLYFAIHTGYLELLEKCKPEGHDGLQYEEDREWKCMQDWRRKLLQKERLKDWRWVYSAQQRLV